MHIDALEHRCLLSATEWVLTDLPAAFAQSGTSSTVVLSQYFKDPSAQFRVRFTTELGDVDLELFGTQKPATVVNFLKYVREGRYDTTIIHRATEPSSGLEVIQGGGYSPPGLAHIPTDPPIVNEASTGTVLSNVRGTIAMARTSDPDSASSEWFINSADNTFLDPAGSNAGYAVFGQVVNNTMTTVDAIQALPTFAFNSPFGEIPLRNYTNADFTAQVTPTANNFVSVTAREVSPLTFAASSSDPNVVTPTVDANGVLTLQYGGPGFATITVNATKSSGSTISQQFAVTSTPTAPAPPVAAFAAGASLDVAASDFAVNVTYTDADGIDAATVGVDDIVVTDPSGAQLTVKSAAVTGAPDAATRIVTYVVSPADGSFVQEDNGDYTVRLRAAQIADVFGQTSTDDQTLGTFAVNAPRELLGTFGGKERFTLGGATFQLTSGQASVYRDLGRLQIEVAGATSRSALTVKGAPVSINDIVVDGPLRSLSAKFMTLAGTLRVAGALGKTTLADISGQIIVAGAIAGITANNVSNTTILAGTDHGSDQTRNTADDSFSPGDIRALKFTGAVTNTVIAAGIDPNNDNYGDGDDVGTGSIIRSLSIKGGANSSTRFVASRLPKSVRIPERVLTLEDARFHVAEPQT